MSEQLYAAQVRHFARLAPLGMTATVVNAAILVFLLRLEVPSSRLAIWFGAALLIVLLRVRLFYRRLLSSPDPTATRRLGRLFTLGAGAAGLLWGAVAIFLFPPASIAHQVFIAFVIGGMVAGAAATHAVLMPAFLAFSLPAVLPLVVRFLLVGEEVHTAMAGMVLVFIALMTAIARRSSATLLDNFRLSFVNSDLIADLSTERDSADETNRLLAAEIAERQKAEEALQRSHAGLEGKVMLRTRELVAANTRMAAEIAERARAEAELERLTRTLEDRVRDRTADVERRVMQLRQLHIELAWAEQRERKRLAVMLHDGLQQLLVAAKLRVNTARERAGAAAQPTLAAVDELLIQSIDASRSLSMELAPPVLYERGLGAALHWLARQMLDKQKLDVRVVTDEDAEPPTEDLRLLLFEGARELLFNVAKHASIGQAFVSLRRDRDEIHLIVMDQGRGFEPDRLRERESPSAGFGLFSIEQRLEWLTGRMQITSAPGDGTQVQLQVPAAVPRAARELPAAPAPPLSAEVVVVPAASPDGRRLRLLLADDHQIVRDGLRSVLAAYPDLEVVAEAANGEEAVELARRYRPDVVVMDVTMPKLDGVEATGQIASQLPGVHVIGLSMHESAELAGAMREAGAAAYLRKDAPIADLVGTIRASVGAQTAGT